MKKIFLTFLTLILILSSTACNKTEEINSVQSQAEKDKKEAKKVVTNFMNELCELDIEDAKEYVLNPEDIPQKITEIASLTDSTESLLKQLPESLKKYKDDFSELFDTATDSISDTLSYKITKSKTEDDKILIDIDLITPPQSEFENIKENISIQAKEQMKIIAEEAFYDGKLSENSTDDETLKVVMPKLFTHLNDYIENHIENLQTESTSIELTLTKKNGKWKITLTDIDDQMTTVDKE